MTSWTSTWMPIRRKSRGRSSLAASLATPTDGLTWTHSCSASIAAAVGLTADAVANSGKSPFRRRSSTKLNAISTMRSTCLRSLSSCVFQSFSALTCLRTTSVSWWSLWSNTRWSLVYLGFQSRRTGQILLTACCRTKVNGRNNLSILHSRT